MNLPLRARLSETEQRMKYYVCMRFQSKATIYGEIYVQISVAADSHTATESGMGVGGSE